MNASMSATCQRAMTARDCPLGHDWVGNTAYVQPYSKPHTQESPMRYENLGPIANPDGSPSDQTIAMLAGTGRDPQDFVNDALVEAGALVPGVDFAVTRAEDLLDASEDEEEGYDAFHDLTDEDPGWWTKAATERYPDVAFTGDEAANAGFVPGVDFVTCDVCEKVEFFTEGVPDWNGETGAHLSCEEAEDPAYHWQPLDGDNVADLLLNVSATLSPDLSAGLAPIRGDEPLYGIVSEDEGGIIAYAIGEDHANRIVKALRFAGDAL